MTVSMADTVLTYRACTQIACPALHECHNARASACEPCPHVFHAILSATSGSNAGPRHPALLISTSDSSASRLPPAIRHV